jgi:hypothetical protein
MYQYMGTKARKKRTSEVDAGEVGASRRQISATENAAAEIVA